MVCLPAGRVLSVCLAVLSAGCSGGSKSDGQPAAGTEAVSEEFKQAEQLLAKEEAELARLKGDYERALKEHDEAVAKIDSRIMQITLANAAEKQAEIKTLTGELQMQLDKLVAIRLEHDAKIADQQVRVDGAKKRRDELQSK